MTRPARPGLLLVTVGVVFAVSVLALVFSYNGARESARATTERWNKGLATPGYHYLNTRLILYQPPHAVLSFPAWVVRYLARDRTISFHVSLLGKQVATSHEF